MQVDDTRASLTGPRRRTTPRASTEWAGVETVLTSESLRSLGRGRGGGGGPGTAGTGVDRQGARSLDPSPLVCGSGIDYEYSNEFEYI